MQIDVVNSSNQKVGAIDVSDEVFGGRVNGGLIWESVVHENAAERRGTHKTKNRANVSGSGKKPWRQKGTGRARVGEIRNPLWRSRGATTSGFRRRWRSARFAPRSLKSSGMDTSSSLIR
jgi:large subunit ribosomal protein L4